MTYEIHSEIYIYPHLPNTPINLDKYTKIFEDSKAQFLDLDLQYCSYATRHESKIRAYEGTINNEYLLVKFIYHETYEILTGVNIYPLRLNTTA